MGGTVAELVVQCTVVHPCTRSQTCRCLGAYAFRCVVRTQVVSDNLLRELTREHMSLLITLTSRPSPDALTGGKKPRGAPTRAAPPASQSQPHIPQPPQMGPGSAPALFGGEAAAGAPQQPPPFEILMQQDPALAEVGKPPCCVFLCIPVYVRARVRVCVCVIHPFPCSHLRTHRWWRALLRHRHSGKPFHPFGWQLLVALFVCLPGCAHHSCSQAVMSTAVSGLGWPDSEAAARAASVCK